MLTDPCKGKIQYPPINYVILYKAFILGIYAKPCFGVCFGAQVMGNVPICVWATEPVPVSKASNSDLMQKTVTVCGLLGLLLHNGFLACDDFSQRKSQTNWANRTALEQLEEPCYSAGSETSI